MKITPDDVRDQRFRKSFRGYDVQEVHAFLDVLADMLTSTMATLADLQTRDGKAKQEMDRLQSALRAKEDTIRELENRLTLANESVDAHMDAAVVLERARSEAESLISKTRAEHDRLSAEIAALLAKKNDVIALLRSFFEAHLAAIGETPPAAQTQEDSQKQQVLQDLDSLVTQRTAMFRKADFEKMLGEDAGKRTDELIDKIFSDLHKKSGKGDST